MQCTCELMACNRLTSIECEEIVVDDKIKDDIHAITCEESASILSRHLERSFQHHFWEHVFVPPLH